MRNNFNTPVNNKYKVHFFLCVLLGLNVHHLSGQTFASDLAAVEARAEDTTKVELLLQFYDTYYTQSNDSVQAGLKYVLDAYHISVTMNYKKGIIESSYRVGANMLTFKNMSKASDFYFITLRNAEEAHDKLMEGKALMGLGLVFYNQKKWGEALEYFDKSRNVLNQNGENKRSSIVIYLEGLCYNALKQYSKAKESLEESISMARTRTDSAQIYECSLGLAKVDYGLMNYDAALEKYDAAKRYYEQQHEQVALALIYEGKADVYLAQNKLEKALEESNRAYAIARSSAENTNLVEITTLLYEIYDRLGNKGKAFQYLLENSQVKDSLNNQDISEKIAVARSSYAFEKKEQKYNEEIAKNRRRKNLAIYSSISLSVLMLLGFVAYQTVKKERRKSEELLLNILPRKTKEELEKYGKAIPKRHPSATIMFCDVQGFTNISSSMSPEDLVNMIDFYFSKFDEIITKHGLEKIKTIGDAYMCAGGLQLPNDNVAHAGKTIDAAIEIMEFVSGVSLRMIAAYGSSFSFRIGIHTGNVVSGVVGSKKYAYDIWGDTVNIAARMEQSSEAGHINISGDTFKLVEGKYNIDYRGKVDAKHKGELDMYYIRWKE
jgi:adenylate cyclase